MDKPRGIFIGVAGTGKSMAQTARLESCINQISEVIVDEALKVQEVIKIHNYDALEEIRVNSITDCSVRNRSERRKAERLAKKKRK